MSRKVFISFLGAGFYTPCRYVYRDFKSETMRFVQVATLQYLCREEEWTEHDVAYILLTQGAEQMNWNDHDDVTGLQSEFANTQLPMKIIPVKDLPEGNNEEEIWTIFERAFALIKEGDELYFDLTHSFRYLPMLMLVMGNYSKFLRGTTIRFMSYGKLEGTPREADKPLINLLPLAALQDWTVAAASFVKGGNVAQLLELSDGVLRSQRREMSADNSDLNCAIDMINDLAAVVANLQLCRGVNVIKSENLNSFLTKLSNVRERMIPPLNPILEKISDSFDQFDIHENIKNGFHAVAWCLKNDLYQQAVTILEENVVSLIAQRHNIAIDNENQRSLVNQAFHIKYKSLPEKNWKTNAPEKVKEILSDTLLQNEDLVSAFSELSEVARNDIDHAGMRLNPSEALILPTYISNMFHRIYQALYGEQYPS